MNFNQSVKRFSNPFDNHMHTYFVVIGKAECGLVQSIKLAQ